MTGTDHNDDKTQSFAVLTKGMTVGHYRIVDKIGAGGMGEVYLAHDTELDRRVALKFLPPHLCRDEDCRKRFKREAQAAARLDHPNIVTVHEVGEFHERPFFVMQHVEGQSLRELIKGKGLSLARIIHLTIEILDGLREAHEADIVHRDIKPSNILIDSKGRPKLVDFGLAAVKGTDRLTKTGSTLGTVGYMSPEQAEGKEVDQRSDLFSAGVVLYEMIAGRRPFDRESDVATGKAIIADSPEPLARYKSGLPDSLQQIVDRALEKNLETRYQTASGMLADLKRLVSSESVGVPGPRKLSKPALASALLVLAIVVAWAGFQIRDWLAPPGVSAKSIAVVDFDNVGSEEDAYLASGLAEDLSIKLRKLEGVQVASSADIRRLAKENLLPREIASRLKVQYALGGSLLREDTLVRVNVEMIDRESGKVVWSDQINKHFTEIFQFLDEVSLRIAQALEVRLTPTERAAMATRPTDNTGAYDHYLKGRHYYYNITFRDNELAEREFERALRSDPDYPLALAGLADVYVQRYKERFDYDEYWLDTAKVLIERALRLEDDLAEAYESRAELYLQEDNITGALQSAEKARELRPDWDEPYIHLGDIFRLRGEFGSALALYDTAVSLRLSVDALCGKGDLLQSRGLDDSALGTFLTAHDLNPDHDRPYIALGEWYEQLSQGEQADSAYRLAIEVRPDHATGYVKLSDRLFYRGSIREAEELLRGFVHKHPYNWDAYEALWNYLVWIEDYPNAIKVIEEAVTRNPDRTWPYLLLATSYAARLSQESESAQDQSASDRAVSAVNRALQLRPNSGRVLAAAGHVFAFLNRPAEAMNYYGQAMTERPGSSTLPAEIAWRFWRIGDYEKAARFALKAVEQAPGIARNYFVLRQTLAPLDRWDEYFDIIQHAALEYSDDPRILYYYAQELCVAGSYEEAISVYQRSLDIKELQEVKARLGFALWLHGDEGAALARFMEAKDSWSSAHWIVAILRSGGRHEEIEEYLDDMKVQSPNYKSGLDHWAEVAPAYFESMRRYDDALAGYREYLTSGEDTRSIEFRTDMAYCFRQKGEFDSARSILEYLAETSAATNRPIILLELARLEAISQPRLDTAVRLAEEALRQLSIPNMQVVELLMCLQFANGQREDAVKSLEKLVALGSWSAWWGSIHYTRAQLAAAMGFSDSTTYLGEAVRSLTHLSRGDYGLGSLAYMGGGILPFRALALTRTGRKHEALDELKRSIRMEPEDADVAYCAACVYSLLDETNLALQWLRTAVDRGNLYLWWAKVDPDLDPLRELPRFKQIMSDWDSRIRALVAKSSGTE